MYPEDGGEGGSVRTPVSTARRAAPEGPPLSVRRDTRSFALSCTSVSSPARVRLLAWEGHCPAVR